MVSVITYEELEFKRALFVHATLGIIDPVLTLTCPKSVTAQAGFDVLAHCVSQYSR
jgi:alcohol dehydrogenase class IV